MWVKRQDFIELPGRLNETGKCPYADDIDVLRRKRVGLKFSRIAVGLPNHHVNHFDRMNLIRGRRLLNMDIGR